jgi:hypothetical protein
MKNVIYFIGLVATLSILFGSIIHLFGNAMGDYVIVVGAIVTTVCLFVIDRLSHKRA